MFKEIGALQAKYSVASLSEHESIFKSISNSIDDNIDEEIKEKVDELVKFMAGILGISELEARKAIKENPITTHKNPFIVCNIVSQCLNIP